MENPLEQPRPEGIIEQVHVFARDLAYGVATGLWGAGVTADTVAGGIESLYVWDDLASRFVDYATAKWNDSLPSSNLMRLFGYFSPVSESSYLLTEKAFALLEKPIAAPQVFISYKQATSSALALLVEARLKMADSNIGVFIDKLLQAGEDWERTLEARVTGSKVFVCLIAPGTLDSATCRKEIQWALGAGSTIVTILHNGYGNADLTRDYPELSRKQDIPIEQESAEEYERAIMKLLNALGYSTI